jgi:hypothetical protein
VQSSATVLGSVEGIASAGSTAAAGAGADPTQEQQEQQQAEKKSDKNGDSEGDDSGVDPSPGLINSGPVQKKIDLEQPVTSGGMETMNEGPASPD